MVGEISGGILIIIILVIERKFLTEFLDFGRTPDNNLVVSDHIFYLDINGTTHFFINGIRDERFLHRSEQKRLGAKVSSKSELSGWWSYNMNLQVIIMANGKRLILVYFRSL